MFCRVNHEGETGDEVGYQTKSFSECGYNKST